MKPITILFLAANPVDTDQLRLAEEVRTIGDRLRGTDFRDRFELIQFHAARPSDIGETLLRFKPDIVHFSGHGSEHGELIFEGQNGFAHAVDPAAFSEFFEILRGVKCVVLSACYTQSQAQGIARNVPVVVGSRGTVGDRTAIAFAGGFYRALGYGQSVGKAFRLGVLEADLTQHRRGDELRLIAKEGLDPDSVLLLDVDAGGQESVSNPATISSTPSLAIANFTVETLRQGQMIRGSDLPLTIEGTYALAEGQYSSGHLGVWVVLQDSYWHYYLQNPSAFFFDDGRWIAMNILPAMGIKLIHFVRVDNAGDSKFRQKVARLDWGAFSELPLNTDTLKTLLISRVD